MNVSIGGIAKTVEITSFDKLGDVKVCMLTTTADGSVGFEQLNDEVRDTIYASFPVDTSSGDIASFEDGADNVPVRELKLNLEPYQNLNGYDSPWVGGAGDNKYPNCAIGGTENDMTVTHNVATETYTLSGTTTAYAQRISSETFTLSAGTYYFKTFWSSSVAGANAQLRSSDGTTTYIAGDGTFTLTGDTVVKSRFTAQANTTLNNITARIMLISGSTAPAAWTPYENICPIYPANGKNLINFINSRTSNGITFSYDSTTGGVTVSGTATANAYSDGSISASAVLSYQYLPKGTYYANLTGYDNGNTYPRLYIQAWYDDDNTSEIVVNSSRSASFTINKSAWLYTRIQVANGETVNGTVYPMVRHAEIADSAYVPYNAIGVTRTGANLWDEQWETGTISGSTGANASDSTRIRSKNYIHVVPNEIYYIHVNYSSSFDGTIQLVGYGKNKEFISTLGWYGNPNHVLFTAPSDVYYIRFIGTTARGASYTQNDISINSPSSASQYEPYQGERYYPISDNPVYGGTLEVETGVLTVTHGGFDMGDYTWGTASDGSFSTNIAGRKTGTGLKAICSSYKFDGTGTSSWVTSHLTEGGFAFYATTTTVRVKDSRYASASDFKTGVTGQIVYAELATPQTYQLTPVQVKTLLGYNNIWTDSGTVEVQYRANIGLYIQKIIGATEDDMVANQNIAANQYFFVGEELYYSTSAISAGQTIVVGTNCIKTNLADALNALNS